MESRNSATESEYSEDEMSASNMKLRIDKFADKLARVDIKPKNKRTRRASPAKATTSTSDDNVALILKDMKSTMDLVRNYLEKMSRKFDSMDQKLENLSAKLKEKDQEIERLTKKSVVQEKRIAEVELKLMNLEVKDREPYIVVSGDKIDTNVENWQQLTIDTLSDAIRIHPSRLNCTASKLGKSNNAAVLKLKEPSMKGEIFSAVRRLKPRGICARCGEKVVGEGSGCTAMDQVFHIQCFCCIVCLLKLQGKPFYALDSKPYCEDCYLNTLEKCCVCTKPILDRILRATGKPYHPQCFTCVVCQKSLDGIPFTVDASNQIHCIDDFHKKFAPRCSVCGEPIMPECGQDETVRVVALDRSFHVNCYKCEDCELVLSSEAEGKGCYPLDNHVLCKSCNARRVQALTSKVTTEL